MTISVRPNGTRKHSAHQLHISTWWQPNWFEYWFLFRRGHVRDYVGKGTKWFRMKLGYRQPLVYKPVTNKAVINFLKSIHP